MIRENWRILLLVVLLVASSVALFVPGMGAGGGASAGAANATDTAVAANEGITNLQYGLELSGGTRLRASAVGITAEEADFSAGREQQIEQTVADELGVDVVDVQARPVGNTVEVFAANVTESAFEDALAAADVEAGTIRDGVTEPTRESIVTTVESKVNAVGFTGANVQTVERQGEYYLLVEAPNQNVSSVRDLIDERGVVTLDAHYPENGTQVNETVLTRDDIASYGSPTTISGGQPAVPVTLTESAATDFARDMQDYGFTSNEGISNCAYPEGSGDDYCLLTVRDDEVVYAAGMDEGLAGLIESGDFEKDPRFVITATTMSEARDLQVNLRAGALPTPLSFEDTYYLSPSLAERFKTNALITGIMAAFAVAIVVFLRYGRAEVAAPMVVTALSEVLILLGFAAATGLALDLSHIAGFIAVIGTGVDDLVIIADEVLTEEVSSRRVFQSRFRKALWIIGAAAVTTIIAMSPLAVLSLGDLRGFAIVTILGVLVGVLITRPAYGDILQHLLTRDR